MFIGQLQANLCSSLINKCPNLHTVLHFINFDLNIFVPPPPQSLALDPPPPSYSSEKMRPLKAVVHTFPRRKRSHSDKTVSRMCEEHNNVILLAI